MAVRTVLRGEGVSAPGCVSATELLGFAAHNTDSTRSGHSVGPTSNVSKADVPHPHVNDNRMVDGDY